jgi:hypothetical protein
MRLVPGDDGVDGFGQLRDIAKRVFVNWAADFF